jgi:hypothetical protein
MNHAIPYSQSGRVPAGIPGGIFFILILASLLYFYLHLNLGNAPALAYAKGTGSSGLTFEYQIISSDLHVDWTGGGDFDPRGKCPQDFLSEGFVVLFKKFEDGGIFRFLFHKGKKLLYRIDKDTPNGQAKIGLHWVESTKYSSKYRIADDAFKEGKSLQVPNAKGGKDNKTFKYGDVVSKKRGQYGRELFRETHINPGQCSEWWDIFNFFP